MTDSNQSVNRLEQDYRQRFELALVQIADALGEFVSDCFNGQPRIDRISARPKSVESFVDKAQKLDHSGKPKYVDPLSEIQDQIGCRIVTFFLADLERIDSHIRRYFPAIEYDKRKPDNDSEFSYFGDHYILLLPDDVVPEQVEKSFVPQFFELQVKTLFQHAWSEADHDVGYKPGDKPLTSLQRRQVAFTSAQAWGADQIFNQLFLERQS